MKQEMTGWQWPQVDHVQIICTSIRTDNHASTLSLNFYKPDALPDIQSTVSTTTTKLQNSLKIFLCSTKSSSS